MVGLGRRWRLSTAIFASVSAVMALDLTHTASIFKTDILSAIQDVINKDLPAVVGFAKSQLRSLAQQSALVAGMIEGNAFTSAEQIFYLDGLDQMAKGLHRRSFRLSRSKSRN